MQTSKITDDFRKLTFGNYITENKCEKIKKGKEVAFEYTKNFMAIRKKRENSVSLVGQVGAGKTHLLCAVSNNLLAMGVQVIYFQYVESIMELRSDYKEAHEKVDELKKAEVLFIDDLFKGVDFLTKFERQNLYTLINYRYLNHLPILVSSELDFEGLLKIDEAIGSRIYEMSYGHRYVFSGLELNHRMKK